MKGFGIGLIFSFIAKMFLRIFDVLMYIIADLLIYFGLWIPSLYMLVTGGFMLFGKLDLSVANAASVLFYVGLALALLGSIIITVRNMILKPLNEHIKYREVRREYREKQAERKRAELYKKHPDKYYAKYENMAPPIDDPVYTSDRTTRNEIPHKTYRSGQDPTLIIHEYDDRYEVYKETGNHIYKIDEKEKFTGVTKQRKNTKSKKDKGSKKNGK